MREGDNIAAVVQVNGGAHEGQDLFDQLDAGVLDVGDLLCVIALLQVPRADMKGLEERVKIIKTIIYIFCIPFLFRYFTLSINLHMMTLISFLDLVPRIPLSSEFFSRMMHRSCL